MSTIYLIQDSSREDNLTFVGTSEDLIKWVKNESGIEVEYPNSNREVYVSFLHDDNPPENEFVKKCRCGKNSTWRGTLLLTMLALLLVYGFLRFISDIISLISLTKS